MGNVTLHSAEETSSPFEMATFCLLIWSFGPGILISSIFLFSYVPRPKSKTSEAEAQIKKKRGMLPYVPVFILSPYP